MRFATTHAFLAMVLEARHGSQWQEIKMRIVTGSGNDRKVFNFPHASIVNRSSKAEQQAGKELLCNLLNVSLTSASKGDVHGSESVAA